VPYLSWAAIIDGRLLADLHTGWTTFGMDEKSFGKGHDYVSIRAHIDNRRVVEVAPERTIEAADSLWKTQPEAQRSEVRHVIVLNFTSPSHSAVTRQTSVTIK